MNKDEMGRQLRNNETSKSPQNLEQRLRILIHDYAGHPFQVQLSRELARRGHEVLHLYAASNPTPKGALDRRPDDPASFSVEGLSVPTTYRRYAYIARWRHEVAYGQRLADKATDWHPDVIISCNTPLDAQRKLLNCCRRVGVPLVFWIQDLLGVATKRILSHRIPVFGRWIGHYYAAMERRIARRSSALIAISDDFIPILRQWGVSDDRLFVIENWAPLNEVAPIQHDNSWRRENGLLDKTCFVYTGMIGLKHNPGLLLGLAQHFHSRPDVAIVVISEGRGADWLALKKAEFNVNGLILLPFQPYERLSEVLSSGDVLVAVLESDAGIFSVPSKVLSYLCAGRPILAAIPTQNLAARIISDNEAGLVVDPGDADKFLTAAETLLADSDLRQNMGRKGRAYAERAFDIGAIADRFEAVIRSAVA